MALVPEAIDELPPSADRVPTLTEVVQLGAQEPHDAAPAPIPAVEEAAAPELPPVPPVEHGPILPDTDALVAEVLTELMPRIDMLLQSRLREVLAPALARAADGLIRDAREGLGTTLQELVQEAVARAMKRRARR